MAESKQNTARFMLQKDDKIEILISCMLEYKTEMDFNTKDFNADKAKFYEGVRQRLAAIYKEDYSVFAVSSRKNCILSFS